MKYPGALVKMFVYFSNEITALKRRFFGEAVFSLKFITLLHICEPKGNGDGAYMQKTCDVAEKATLAKKKLRKKCVNRDKSA